MRKNLKALSQAAPSPLQRLRSPQLEAAQVACWVKRDDLLNLTVLNDSFAFSGNKWRKLKYNLVAAQEAAIQQLLTFGGAFSNHLAAVAAAGHYFGFKTLGIVRGEAPPQLNPTLHFAKRCGMKLQFITRTEYRQKETLAFQQKLKNNLGEFYLIPEGGTNAVALRGSSELAEEILAQADEMPDEIRLCCGTGGTAAGLIQGLAGKSWVKGYSVLKGDFHRTNIQSLLNEPHTWQNWQVYTDAHCGGYAKTTPELLQFMQAFTQQHQLYLDPIYTGKLFYALWNDLEAGRIAPGTKIIVVHSGGLQGVAGYNERFGTSLPLPKIK